MRATSLAFITPVYERYAMTEICLRQRKRVCDSLREDYGLDATVIVIGDDNNLSVAESLGFVTVEHSNWSQAAHVNRGEPFVCLGQKFNAGYGMAHKLGIDLVFPIGSDSWIDPIYFSELPEPNEILLSRAYNLVTPDAKRRGALWIGWEGGVQWITWTEDWAHRKYMPVSVDLSKGCDTSTWLHLKRGLSKGENHHHQLEYVAFQSPENQITDYAGIMARYGSGEVTGPRVFGDLYDHYHEDDITAMRLHYNEANARRVVETLRLMHEEMVETEQELEQLEAEHAELSKEAA